MKRLFLLFLLLPSLALATVPASTSRVAYTCNGVTVNHPFTFGVSDSEDLAVITRTTTGSDITLVEGTGYTVSCTNQDCTNGGTVVVSPACASGTRLTIIRDVPVTQETDFIEGMPSLYDTFESQVDTQARIEQQVSEALNRAPKIAAGSSYAANSYTFPDPAASKVIGWNSTGTALTTYDQGTGGGTTIITDGPWLVDTDYATLALADAAAYAAGKLLIITQAWGTVPDTFNSDVEVIPSGALTIANGQTTTFNGSFKGPPSSILGTGSTIFNGAVPHYTVSTVALLRALPVGTQWPGTIQVLGYRNAGDGSGGPPRVLGTAGGYTDNGGSILVPTGGDGSVAFVYRDSAHEIIVDEFGAYGDGTHDDKTVFETAFGTGKTIYGKPGKTYRWSAGVVVKPVDYQGLACLGDGKCLIECEGEGLYFYGNSGDFGSFNFIEGFTFQYTGTPTTWTFTSGDITVAAGPDLGYITKAGTTLVDGDIITITSGSSAITGVSRGRAYYVDMNGNDIHLYSLYDSDGFDYPSTISGVGSGTYTLTLATTGVVFNGVRHYSTDYLIVNDFPLNMRLTRELRGDADGDSGGHYGNHIGFNSNRGICGLLNTHEANQQEFTGGVFMGNVFHANFSGSVNSIDGTSFEGANGVDELGVFGSTVAVNGVRFEKSGVGGRWAAEENVNNSMLFSFNGCFWGGGSRPTSWGDAAVSGADTNANEFTMRGVYPAVVRSAATNNAFSSAVDEETYARVASLVNGTVKHGDGTIAPANIVMAPGGPVYVEQTPTYSATMAFDLSLGHKIRVTGITGGLTINKPTSIVGVPEILLELGAAVASGTQTITFSSDFRTILASNQLSITQNKRTVIHFEYNPALDKFIQSTAPVENLP